MVRQQPGPRRARSVESYLPQTRAVAVLALIAFGGSVMWDASGWAFWVRHALLASLVASLIVVMLSVAVINEVVERRKRQRWSVLPQYVIFELVRNARMVWSGILEVAGVLPPDADHRELIVLGADVVCNTDRLSAAVRDVVADADRRSRLHAEIVFLAEHADETVGRWANVMLGTDVYAEVVDRHVELAGDVAWLGALLDNSHPPDDARRQRRGRSNPAVQIMGDVAGEWLADRIVVTTQLAEALDRGTLDLALRIVPVQWWEGRLGTDVPAEPGRAALSDSWRALRGAVGQHGHVKRRSAVRFQRTPSVPVCARHMSLVSGHSEQA